MTASWKSDARGLAMVGALAAMLVAPTMAEAQMGPRGGGVAAIDGVQRQYESVRDFMLTTARGIPEDLLSYQPTEEVRTFAQLLGHVANASYLFCAGALGEDSPATSNHEEDTTKAALVSGLEAAFAYCDRAHEELRGPRLFEEMEFFGQTGNRLWVLAFNATHTWEHYGNLVTYMRLNGVVPPSSGGMAGGQ